MKLHELATQTVFAKSVFRECCFSVVTILDIGI